MLPHDVLIFATLCLTIAATNGASSDLEDLEDYEVLTDNEAGSVDNDSSNVQEVRCYCNQPECVPQGYMCRGRSCFTELPSSANTLPLSRMEQSAHSGCLGDSFKDSFKDHQCPTGFFCCIQDLCNHVDNPAMRNRLNKTLQVVVGDQRTYMSSLQPNSQATDGWFRTATIAVPICGIIVLLILASLAVRLLQPVPSPVRASGKFASHRTSVNEPPLLASPKVPLV